MIYPIKNINQITNTEVYPNHTAFGYKNPALNPYKVSVEKQAEFVKSQHEIKRILSLNNSSYSLSKTQAQHPTTDNTDWNKKENKILFISCAPSKPSCLQSLLKTLGYNIQVENRATALNKIAFCKFDLLIIDIETSNIDGFEIAEIIQKQNLPNQQPIIFLIPNDTEYNYLEKGLLLGAIDCIKKPINTELIQIKIEAHFEKTAHKKEIETLKIRQQELIIKLDNKRRDIQDSINYASQIQKSIFPKIKTLEAQFNKAFIIYKPKDTIGGDFYWIAELNNRFITVCADCTGHGVPGAMLSMIGFQSLIQIIKENRVFNPGKILTLLHQKMGLLIIENDSLMQNGMDISICVFNMDNNVLEYASAKRPILIESENKLIELKGDNKSIGDNSSPDFKYNTFYHPINAPTWVYQFSDGIHDQFGGPKSKKYGRKRLRKMLESNLNKAPYIQKNSINFVMNSWADKQNQTDDITIMGFQISPNQIASRVI